MALLDFSGLDALALVYETLRQRITASCSVTIVDNDGGLHSVVPQRLLPAVSVWKRTVRKPPK